MEIKKIIAESVYTPIRFLENLIDSPAVILIYHRVTKTIIDPQLLAVEPENFYTQIDYLKKNYNLLTVEEFSHLIRSGKKLPSKSVLITLMMVMPTTI